MAGDTAGETIYNSTDGPLSLDDEGRLLGARETLKDVDVHAEPVKTHIAEGRIVVVGGPTKRTIRVQKEG